MEAESLQTEILQSKSLDIGAQLTLYKAPDPAGRQYLGRWPQWQS